MEAFFSFLVHESLKGCIRIGFLIGSNEVGIRLCREEAPAELLYLVGFEVISHHQWCTSGGAYHIGMILSRKTD